MIKELSKKKKKGFSLVELIVVIAIIAILAAVAVPKYSQYQENARIKADIATAKIVADATNFYLIENEKESFTFDIKAGVAEGTDKTEGAAILLTLNTKPKLQMKKYDKIVVTATDGNVVVTAVDTNSVKDEMKKGTYTLYPNQSKEADEKIK